MSAATEAEIETFTVKSVVFRGGSTRNGSLLTSHLKTCIPLAWETNTLGFILEIYFSFPLALLGIGGNILAFVVLCVRPKHGRLQATFVILQGLAMVDALILIMTIPSRFAIHLGAVDNAAFVLFLCSLIVHVVYVHQFLRFVENWFTVLVTVDRFIAICKPLHAKRLCTVKNALKCMAIVILLSFVAIIPRLTVGISSKQSYHCHAFTIAYTLIISPALLYVIPIICYITFNLRLVHALLSRPPSCTAVARQGPSKHPSITSQGESQSSPLALPQQPLIRSGGRCNNLHFTVIVIIIVTMSVICAVANLINQFWRYSSYCLVARADPWRQALSTSTHVANLLSTVNSSANIFVYCFCSKKFRSVIASRLVLILHWGRQMRHRRRRLSSGVGGDGSSFGSRTTVRTGVVATNSSRV